MASLPELADIRDHLNIPETDTDFDDWLSTWCIPAAIQAVEHFTGPLAPKTFDEYYDGADYSIWLRHTPVLSVQLVEEGWGFTNYSLTEIEVNSAAMPTMFAFSIDLPETGKISRRSGGNVNIPFIRGQGNIHVIYQAGRADIPEIAGLAIMQLCETWFTQFRQRSVGTAPVFQAIEGTDQFGRSGATTTAFYFGTPSWLPLMLEGIRKPPIIG